MSAKVPFKKKRTLPELIQYGSQKDDDEKKNQRRKPLLFHTEKNQKNFLNLCKEVNFIYKLLGL